MMDYLGVTWVGINAENGRKLLLSLALIAIVTVVAAAIRAVASVALNGRDPRQARAKFWTRQVLLMLGTAITIVGLLSIWFSDPARLATAFGLVSAGLAFALQRVITSIAGYFVILRSNNFTVGDRIAMGGVRGDVMALGFIQTTIMEMGQPPSVTQGGSTTWVRSRQFTGRIVTVSNAKIFDDPVYNYTRDFPFIWEEMVIPITYSADRAKAERIMLDAALAHAFNGDRLAEKEKGNLQERFGVEPIDLKPTVYWRITDNWLELTVRFVLETHRIRGAKSDMARQIIAAFDEAGIGIASATYDIVGLPPIEFGDAGPKTAPPVAEA